MEFAVAAGSLRLGVKVSEPDLGEQLRERLSDLLVEGEAPPNLRVLAGRHAEVGRPKHLLYWRGALVLRTSEPAELEEAVRLHAAAASRAAAVLELRAWPVRTPRGIVAVDHRLARSLLEAAPRLRRAGVRVLPAPTVPVDGTGLVDLDGAPVPLLALITDVQASPGLWAAQLTHTAQVREGLGRHLGGGDVDRLALVADRTAVVTVDRHEPRALVEALAAYGGAG